MTICSTADAEPCNLVDAKGIQGLKSRTPEQRLLFRRALDEGAPLQQAMIVAGYSPTVARQGRAKLCSALLLDLEDWEREQREFEQTIRHAYFHLLMMQAMGIPLDRSDMQAWWFIRAQIVQFDRKERHRRKYARRTTPRWSSLILPEQ